MRIKIKNLLNASLGIFLVSAISWSCSSDKINPDDPGSEEDNGEPSFQQIDIVYPFEAYIGSVSGELGEALNVAVTNRTGAIGSDTRLIILGSLLEIDESVLQQAYENGATIAVERPSETEFVSFFASHPDWEGFINGTPLDNALLYSFDKDDCVALINIPEVYNDDYLDYFEDIEEDEVDPSQLKGEEVVPEFEDPTPSYYFYIRSWLGHLINDELDYSDGEVECDVDKFSKGQHIETDMYFTLDPQVRRVASSKPDLIKDAKASVNVNMTVYQIHVYQGAENEGNYYLVYASTEFNSGDAWKGVFHNIHGGVHVRGAGFYAKELQISFELLNENKEPAKVIFPGSCPPKPDNINNKTEYKQTSSFNIGTSLSVSGGHEPEGWSLGGKGSVSAGWTWGHEVSASIENVSVSKFLSSPIVGWKLEFNNTPYYDTNKPYWINVGTNTNSRSSQTLNSTWVWYEPDSKDDDNKGPYSIKVKVNGTYEAVSFISTKADWKAVTKPMISEFVKTGDKTIPIEGKEQIISLRKGTETRTVGNIKIKNGFKDKFIQGIKLWSYDDSSKVFYNKNFSHGPGDTVDLGNYFVKNAKYVIGLYAKEPEGETSYYQYELNRKHYFELGKGDEVIINAPNDFRLIPE